MDDESQPEQQETGKGTAVRNRHIFRLASPHTHTLRPSPPPIYVEEEEGGVSSGVGRRGGKGPLDKGGG